MSTMVNYCRLKRFLFFNNRIRLLPILFLFPIISACHSTHEKIVPRLGVPASQELIQQWNTDVFSNGEGLPAGQGTAIAGEAIYQKYCLSCHGLDGTGDSADELAGAEHSLTDNPPDKIMGQYWPYATTLFDFTRRAMPLNSPGILSNNELYAVTAYLLYLNGIIKQDSIMNAENLAAIKMSNRHGFIDVYHRDRK